MKKEYSGSSIEDIQKAQKVFQDVANCYGEMIAEMNQEEPNEETLETLSAKLLIKVLKIQEL